MELNELTALWKDQDTQLDNIITVNRSLLKEISIQKVRSRLGHIKWSAVFSIVTYIIFLGFIAEFILANYGTVKFLLPGLALFIYSLAGIYLNVYRLILYYQINAYDAVLKTQKVSEKLNYLDQFQKKSLYVAIPLFWVAFAIVTVKAMTGYDLYQQGTWLMWSAAASALIAVIVVFYLKKFPDKRLRSSIDFLRELAENERQG